MNFSTKILLALVAMFCLTFGLTYLFYGINMEVFWSVFFYVGLFTGVYIYISISRYMDEKSLESDYEQKKSFTACWNKMNDILSHMPSGKSLKWSEGFSRQSNVRVFSNGVERRTFRSMLGYLDESKGSNQLVLIIFDIDNRDIAFYLANPPPSVLEDHFNKFKPFDRDMSPYGSGHMGNPNYWDRRRRGISIYPGGSSREGGSYSPMEAPDTVVDGAIRAMDRP